jgi:hypothetical protein
MTIRSIPPRPSLEFELLIAAGSRPRKRMLFGSDAVTEVLRRYGVSDGE